jgi:two-component system, cell cycle sensor histidine kinase and response regulator CckA
MESHIRSVKDRESAIETGDTACTAKPTSMVLRVLMVEDSATDAKLIAQALRKSSRPIELERVEDATAMRAALASRSWDIILSDWSLPTFSAMGALDVLKESGLDLPFIIVSGTVGEEAAVDAMHAGARDYVLKDRLGRLIPAIERELREHRERASRRESELRSAAIVRCSLDPIIATDHTGRVIEFNPAAEKCFGYSHTEAVGQSLADLVVPDRFREEFRARLDGAQSGVADKPRELTAKRKDGTEFPIERTITRLDDRSPPIIMGFIRDLSERDKAEAALREAKTRFTRLAESGLVGIIIAESTGRIVDANEAFLKMVGYSWADLAIGLSWSSLTPAEWAPVNIVLSEHIRERGVAGPWEKEYLRKDGSRVPVLVGVATLEGNRNISLSIDLTALRQAEAARARAEDEYRVLFENSPLPKWLYDVDTLRILAVNDAMVRTYGYTRDELLKMTIMDIRPTSTLPKVTEALRTHLAAGDGSVGVWCHRRKDGTSIEMELHTHTFVNAGMTQRLVVAKDVTQERRLEEQLRQAQKMEAVGRLAGGVAHDFNNLLSVILSYGEMLLTDLPPGEPIRDDIEQITRAGRRAADLTRQLLSFSRQQVLAPKVLNLNDVLVNVDKMLRRVLGADVDLALLPEKALGQVRVDPGSIEQVMMNLVVNARDAMPTGGKLTIETRNVVLDDTYAASHPGVKAGHHVMVAVSDTGTGMDAATLRRIFEPFFTTKGQGKGTGLGLSTVFGIISQSGGTVWVYSEVGVGTTFKIYLPRVDDAVDSASEEPPAVASHGTETILLVDDDDQVRLVTQAILRKYGYHVIDARNAGEALLQVESYPGTIHLLLTDVVMPQMSGPELARRLARSRPELKLLCMSGYTDDSIVRHGVIEGHIAFLQKPVTPVTLIRKVRAVLDGPTS